ncbi:DEAD/DEAH box helicase [Novispirillum sp. DQ9]|uniref:DEAD/DEAH box helicase n=1 Tax=Novispirillum sp. DQ9 TaxID=3398612 RepID=UPI003C79B606
MTKFEDMGLIEALSRAIAQEGYTAPTPIQAQAIPFVLEGRDVLGVAQTGTGKTAAFSLPILQRLAAGKRAAPGQVRALVLTPTRELAHQVAESFATYGRHLKLSQAVIHGGVGANPQITALRRGVDILVATPGRTVDLMQQGHLKLDSVGVFVLDEADRMLDMGFIHAVKKIIAVLPEKRQTLLFTATMPADVVGLIDRLLKDYKRVEVTPVSSTAERIAQKVLFVSPGDKQNLLFDLLSAPDVGRAIVFTRTKHGANRLSEQMAKRGLMTEAIHGNKSQSARMKALDAFKSGELRALIATDIAARGIDVDGVTHVVNFDLPNEPESYVHRIGRTARAGATGVALSLCVGEDLAYLKDIEKTIRQAVPVDDDHAYHCVDTATIYHTAARMPKPPVRGGQRQGQGQRQGPPKAAAGAPKAGAPKNGVAKSGPVRPSGNKPAHAAGRKAGPGAGTGAKSQPQGTRRRAS